MSTAVKSIRIVDPRTIEIVETYQRRTQTPTATKAAMRMIERFDAVEQVQHTQRSGPDTGEPKEGTAQASITAPAGVGGN